MRIWAMRIWAMRIWAMRIWTAMLGLAGLLIVTATGFGAEATNDNPPPDFEKQIAPILVRRCLECHDKRNASGGLTLTSRNDLIRGGDGGPAIDLEAPEQSFFLERITAGEMPPPLRSVPRKLPDSEIKLLRNWLKRGAPWPRDRELDLFERTTDVRAGRDWWSLKPVERPTIPVGLEQDEFTTPPKSQTQLTATASNPIDAFILTKLQQQGMRPAPPADRRTLIRRLYFDVVGLPPSQADVEAFLADDAPLAWERLVDRVLASPHFGERWARHWLDVVRFAETSGYERDQPKPFAWRYRDWVVGAFNRDLPFDSFVVQQLAGDEWASRSESSTVATGFLRLGSWNDEPNDPQDYQYDRLEDLVHATSSAFLGMTVKCARCHDHKFDPIPQADYYRLAAIFWPGPIAPRQRDLLGGPSSNELGYANVLGWTDVSSSPRPLHVLKAGDRQRPLNPIEPATLTLVPELFGPLQAPPKAAKTTRRREQFARWIVDKKNPLTPRVWVNRIWQHYFGKGLVRTPNNFGFRGDPPTHPTLLDWLATELLRSNWRAKPLHRLMLTSQTYRQASIHPDQARYAELDFENQWWWRAERRRLDAESLRDAMLVVGDQLDRRLGGPSFRPEINPEALEGLSRKTSAWTASSPKERRRRSLYTFLKRGLLPPLLTTFDLADSTLPCGRRDVTTVAPQALALMNHRFGHDCSQALARRVERLAGDDDELRIELAWQLTLNRSPDEMERRLAQRHLDSQRKRFNTSRVAGLDVDQNRQATGPIPLPGVTLHLQAGVGVERDDVGRVTKWRDQSGRGHHAHQVLESQRPSLSPATNDKRATIEFDGQRRFLHVDGQLLKSPNCTLFVVATDRGKPGHRELISNWSGRDGNSVTSVFLGLTGTDVVRFTDQVSDAGRLQSREELFVLSAVNGSDGTQVFQNGRLIGGRDEPLRNRRLDTPWVLGQQGNIDGEYWHGGISEILVFDRTLTEREHEQTCRLMCARHGIHWRNDASRLTQVDPRQLALESLCHVLLNTNEFLYVD